ncbi:transmembrane protein 87A-like [Planococcus citri]|uniref:transmembrane protein 87A-like n=1 Tax=Planococcus citri TaxID=170843 RepID=UPI0031F757CC
MVHTSFSTLLVLIINSAFISPNRDRLRWNLFSTKMERNAVIGPNSSQEFYTFRSGGSLFQGSQISLQISCEPDNYTNNVNVEYALIQISSWDDYLNAANFSTLSLSDIRAMYFTGENRKNGHEFYIRSGLQTVHCEGYKSLLNITRDGLYLLILQISHPKSYMGKKNIDTNTNIVLNECVLLPLYFVFRLVYACLALIWGFVILKFWNKDLLPRVLLWIGAIILMALIESTIYHQEYSTLCETTQSFTPTMVFLAELFSTLKRTLTGMLVLNMSVGWSIVEPNPKVGSHLSRVSLVGIIYFILAAIQSYVRIWGPHDSSYLWTMIGILLMSLESFVCCWIFYCLAQTKRLLQVQRKFVMLSAYKCLTFALLAYIVIDIIYAIYCVNILRAPSYFDHWATLWTNNIIWDFIFFCKLHVFIQLYLELFYTGFRASNPKPKPSAKTQKKICYSTFANV